MTDNNATQIERDRALLTKRALQIHRGAARAAVLGINDGLVSTLCIILGVSAAAQSGKAVLIAGFAGLIAGAVSMAAGEWISVVSQVDLFKGVLADLKRLVKHDKEILMNEIEADFVRIGLDKKSAEKAVDDIATDEAHLIDVYARNVIGINPTELGSPLTAATSSFSLFTAGALIALCPWFFTDGTTAMVASIGFTIFAGLIVGGYITKSSGGNITRGAVRQLLIIVLAAVVTYSVGRLFGNVV